MANLLDKASILLTPTAYDNGSMLSIKPTDGDGDFTFSRNSAATRVNAQGLVENVQILSSNLVQNGSFSEIGAEEVTNGSFSQEGSELVTNGGFATDSDWSKGTGITISGGSANFTGVSGEYLSQNALTFGNTYYLSFNVSNYTSGSLTVFGGAGNDISSLFNINSIGNYTGYFKAGGVNNEIYFGSGFIGSIDNVSVKEVGQDWTLGTGWSIGDGEAIATSGASTKLTQSISGLNGKTCKVSFTLSDYGGSGSVRVDFGSVTTDPINTNGEHIVYGTYDNNAFELFKNTGFEGSITNISVKEVGQNWNIENTWTIGNSVANGNGANGSSEEIIQTSVLVVGKEYKATYQVLNYVSGSVALWKGSGVALTQRTANNTYTEYFTGASNQIRFRGTNFIGSITNIVIKEITDDTNLPRINYEGFSYQDALGSEQIVNGTFNDGSNWTTLGGWSIGGGSANCNGGSIMYTNGSIEVSKTYKVTYDIINYVSGNVRSIFNGTTTDGNGTTRNANGTFTELVQSTDNASGTFSFGAVAGSFIGSIDNVSVKEYLGQEVVPDSGCGSWLLEPQSTNLIPYSTDFSTWLYGSDGFPNNMTRVDGQSSPDGGTNSSLYTRNSGTSGFFGYGNTTVVLGNTYTYSIFIKKGTSSTFQINNVANSPQSKVTYNIDTDTFTQEQNASGKAVNFGNGWYRVSMTYEHTNTSGTSSQIRNYLGDGESMYVFGAQTENQSYATSYIPTSGASSTRLRDIATDSGNSTLINSTEGVLYAEFSTNNTDGSNWLNISDTTAVNWLFLGKQGGYIRVYLRANNSVIFDYTKPLEDKNKIALSYKSGDIKVYINGVNVGNSTNTFSFTSALSRIDFNQYNGGGTQTQIAWKALAVYKEALTDAELTALTTI